MPTDPSFRMTIGDVFSIRGRGTVVIGCIEVVHLKLATLWRSKGRLV
jgi:translation elongation factor EF-Tu-like GTPase